MFHRSIPRGTQRAMHLWRALSALLVLSACNGMRANEEAKAASVSSWQNVQIGEQLATQYLLERSGALLIGVDGFVPNPNSPYAGGVPTLHGKVPETLRGAAAVAVDKRGYWLTAAHCIADEPMLLVTSNSSEVRWWPVRVAWNGFEHGEEGGVDLALLQVNGEPFGVVRLGDTVPTAGAVLCAGWGLSSNRFAAGTITGMSTSTADSYFTEVLHDTPLSVGDSGGPAILSDGTLVGVDILTMPRYSNEGAPQSTALHVDPTFVRRLIDADAMQRDKSSVRRATKPQRSDGARAEPYRATVSRCR